MAALGKAWRGALLEVRLRQRPKGGGLAGKSYEVALSSLSEPLQRAFYGDVGNDFRGGDDVPAIIAAEPRRMAATSQTPTIARRLAILERIMRHPRGSSQRAAAIEAATRPHLGRRTIQRWVADFEAADGDLTYLGRKRPADAGIRRVQVSRTFDRAYLDAGHPIDRLAHWGARRDQLIKDVWASPAQRAGWKRVRLEVKTFLRRECEADGINLPTSAFEISQRAIMDTSYFREVDIYAHDRKTWDDSQSRIRRDRSMWKPLEEVVLDVHHIDVVLTRPDGREMYPKLVAFLDSGTSRLFHFVVFPPKGEAVHQEHVLMAFLAMVEHPDWGLPQRIYMDDGSEICG